MPELPEVETIKKGLEQTVVGRTIRRVQVRLPKIVSIGPKTVSNRRRAGRKTAEIFAQRLRGLKITGISRRAKMLIIKLFPSLEGRVRKSKPHQPPPPSTSAGRQGGGKGWSLLIHLKMTGQLIFAGKREQKKRIKILNLPQARVETLPHKYTHVIFEFADGSRLYYNDMRQFGYLRLIHNDELSQVKELVEYGPEPFSKEFSPAYLVERAKRRPALALKTFLMDPRAVAGIGNIYSDEILYWAGLRPNRRLRSLSRADWRRLYGSALRVLKKAARAQGSSVGDFFKVDGSEGRFGRQHMVYGRYGENCYTCSTKIKRLVFNGRSGSFCPKCQK